VPVLGSGDCVEPEQIVERMRHHATTGSSRPIGGVLVGRGVLRNPWILAQASDLAAGRPARQVTLEQRGQFLLEYIQLLLDDAAAEAAGFRHVAPGMEHDPQPARGRERWVINKLRALCAWYSRGLDGGSLLRVQINSAQSIQQLRDIVCAFFLTPAETGTESQRFATT
jgi:tRNA-dihydrouridine synthase